MINTSVPRSLDGGQLSTLGYYLWESPQAQEGRGLVMMVTMKMRKNGDDDGSGGMFVLFVMEPQSHSYVT